MGKRAPKVRFSKKVCDFICDKVAEGLTVAEICDRRFKEITPSSATVYRWERKYKTFKENLTASYDIFFQRKLEELEFISTEPAASLYPDLDYKERAEARRARLDTLKFELGKLAPVMAKRFRETRKVEHTGGIDGPPIFVIQNYAVKSLEEGITVDEEGGDES